MEPFFEKHAEHEALPLGRLGISMRVPAAATGGMPIPALEGETLFERLAPNASAGPAPDVAAINAAFAGRFEFVGPPLAVLFGNEVAEVA